MKSHSAGPPVFSPYLRDLLCALTVLWSWLSAFTAFAAPPRYDHVVIVIEENRTPGQIIGDLVNAPFITSLATGGVSLASMFAIEHPSQPNYFQLFSGSNQGVVDDNLPPDFSTTPTSTYPFNSPTTGRELVHA